jgi:hypothetical protein
MVWHKTLDKTNETLSKAASSMEALSTEEKST